MGRLDCLGIGQDAIVFITSLFNIFLLECYISERGGSKLERGGKEWVHTWIHVEKHRVRYIDTVYLVDGECNNSLFYSYVPGFACQPMRTTDGFLAFDFVKSYFELQA